jgi:hypothetical protein
MKNKIVLILSLILTASLIMLSGASYADVTKAYNYLAVRMDRYAVGSSNRLIESYEKIADPISYPVGVFEGQAYLYDNALAIIAFLERGNPDDLIRAKILANSFINLQEANGRLRDFYDAKVIPIALTAKASADSRSGDMAWEILALLQYYKTSNDTDQAFLATVLDAAKKLANFTVSNLRDNASAGFFHGLLQKPNGTKSVEQNIDLYVAFMRLYEITKDANWKAQADWALQYVRSTFKVDHYPAGTGNELVMDTNPLATLGMVDGLNTAKYTSMLNWSKAFTETLADGFIGFDFDTNKDGIWFEGTSQMVLAYKTLTNIPQANLYLNGNLSSKGLRNVQAVYNSSGIPAASHHYVTTPWYYLFKNPHIAATCWYIFAERSYNPLWGMYIFNDVPVTHWAYNFINGVSRAKIMVGYEYADGRLLSPSNPVTRAEMAVVLTRACKLAPYYKATPTFADVPQTYWAYPYIEAIYRAGITSGIGYNASGQLLYGPENINNRAAGAIFICKAKAWQPYNKPTPTFADVPSTHSAYGYIEKLYLQGVTSGAGKDSYGRLIYKPEDNLTRDQLAGFLCRAFDIPSAPAY